MDNRINRLTVLYNDVDQKEHEEIMGMVEKIGIEYRPIPTSGCYEVWAKNDEGVVIERFPGPTAVKRFLNSQLEVVTS